jgi:flagellar assembly protein FliH
MLEADVTRQPFRPLWQSVAGQSTFAEERFDRVWSGPEQGTEFAPDQSSQRFDQSIDGTAGNGDSRFASIDRLSGAGDSALTEVGGIPAPTFEVAVPRVLAQAPISAPVIDPAQLQREREAGYAEGRSAALIEMRGAIDRECEGVRELLRGIQTALGDNERFFVPLERLALHLARQIVRGELSLSGQAISRLVEGCLAEIDARGQSLLLRLNPADHDRLLAMPKTLDASISVVRDSTLTAGSVRIEMAEGMVEDLIEHRLDSLSQSLLAQPWSGPRTFEHLAVEHDGDS